MSRRHEKPIRRVNPGGDEVFVARYTRRDGKRRSAGTFPLKGPCRKPDGFGSCCAQHAIDAAYDRDWQTPLRYDTVGAYAKTWTQRHPRSERTNEGYNARLKSVLDAELDRKLFRDWPMGEVRPRQAYDLVTDLLVRQGRAHRGAVGVMAVLSSMWTDAIRDEVAEINPFLRVRIRASDPRIVKAPRPVRVWTWGQMHDFARAAAVGDEGGEAMRRWRTVYAEAMVRTLSDCGLRLGELLGLQHEDWEGDVLQVRRTAHYGSVQMGTKTDHGEPDAGRVVPVPPVLLGLLAGLPRPLRPGPLFPTVQGHVWREGTFYRGVWNPARKASGMDPRPHEFRHGYISWVRPEMEGHDADLADAAGHTVATMAGYTHALRRSHEAIRRAVGE